MEKGRKKQIGFLKTLILGGIFIYFISNLIGCHDNGIYCFSPPTIQEFIIGTIIFGSILGFTIWFILMICESNYERNLRINEEKIKH